MNFQLYHLKLTSSHFGSGSLETSNPTIPADSLFSALFIEAIKLGKEDQLLSLALNNQLLMSDTFLYQEGIYFPKPIGYPKLSKERQGNRRIAKLVKKLNAIHEDDLDAFIQGESQEEDLIFLENNQNGLYSQATQTRVGEDPYRVSMVRYHDTSLVFIASELSLLEELMDSLQYSGIGGKRSSGLGRFEFTTTKLEDYHRNRLTTDGEGPVMLINTSLPNPSELARVVDHPDTRYLLEKISGFIASSVVKDPVRKNDYYKFKAGSTFSQTFKGELVDLAPKEYQHPVWNYNIPLFYRLREDG